jgi:hypothetical protein
MKPAMAEQAKAISSAINASSSNGFANSNTTNNATTSSNATSNYNYPGSKDAWSEQAQRGNIPR